MAHHTRTLLTGLLVALMLLLAAPASATERGLDCEGLLSEESRANLPGSGFEANPDTTFSGFDDADRDYPGALSCSWGVPQTDNLFWLGVAPVSADAAATEQATLAAAGWTSRESDGGALFEIDPAQYGYIVEPVSLFRDGYWFIASDYALLAPMISNVLGAEVAQATDECDALLSENQRTLLAQYGIARSNDELPFQSDAPSDGVFCTWNNTLSLAYAEVSEEEAERLRAAAIDFFPQSEGLYAGAGAAWASEMYFADGYWFLTYRMSRDIPLDTSAIELRDRIFGARATTAPATTEPVAVEPSLLEADPVAPQAWAAATPSTLSSLPPAQTLEWNILRFAALAGAAIVLTALLVLPGKLVDTALEGNYGRLGLPQLRLPSTTRARPRVLTIAVGVLLASAISVYVDPAIGLNDLSARVFASTLTAVVIESVLGLWLVARVARRVDPSVVPSLRFTWNSLIFILLAALISRLIGFEPGMMFGLVIGLSYAGGREPRREHRVVWAEAGIVLVIGLLAYTAYSAFFVEASESPDSVLGVLALYARETLSALTIATIFALPIVLLPVRGMLGPVLWRHNRLIWFGGYAAAVFLLFAIVLPLEDSWEQVGNTLDQWLWLLIAYVLAAVLVWALLTFLPTPRRLRENVVPLADHRSGTDG
ncbi:hypothetical protein HQQ81_00415 [Microbacteriaceae bacterium VKM Ac-2854]|nr:hypothetical protein [Microbacteriaceae bacterium VKM Ac-2854]